MPRASFVELLNIDDRTALQRLSHQGSDRAPRPDRPDRQDYSTFAACEEAYTNVGLAQHPKKRVRGSTHATIVGAEVEGRIGIVSSPVCCLAALVLLTLLQVQLPQSTPGILQSFVGSWTAAFLYRQPLLSTFAKIYIFLASLNELDSDAPVTLPGYIRDELLLAALLAPFAHTNLRAAAAPFLYGTDASLRKGAIVRAPISESTSRELYRQSEHGGWHTRLDSQLGAYLTDLGLRHPDAGLPSEGPSRGAAPEWVTDLCEALSFARVYDYSWRRVHHINILEASVIKSLAKFLATRHPGTRTAVLVHSQVALGAQAHGRSSSPGLSRVFQSALPYVLGRGFVSGLPLHSDRGSSC